MDISKTIDHTLLKPDASSSDVEKLCREAAEYKFKAVCVNPSHIKLCSEILKGTDVKIAAVIGFPLGAGTTESKVFETKDAVGKGANEIDMVINIGALKEGNLSLVENEIKAVVEASAKKTIVKVIIETCLLTDEEKITACKLSKSAGAHFVKTSTGFSTGGATVEDVALMKSVVGDALEVKASGGVRDYETAIKMIEAGASRIGTSSGIKIIKS